MRISTILAFSTLTLTSTSVHGCGLFEYYDFVNLDGPVMEAATTLGYDASTWDNVRTNPIEFLNFEQVLSNIETITEAGMFTPLSGDISGAMMTADLFDDDGLCWDFYVNHYDGYSWAELDTTYNPFDENVQDIVADLGWDETSWDDTTFTIPIPASECMEWARLEPMQKWAYRALGWNQVTWDAAPSDPRCGN